MNTPVVVLSDRLMVAGSRASAWGGVSTPARKSPSDDGDRVADASYNGLNAVEGAASGKVVIQQGVDSSGRDTELPTAPSAVFTSAERNLASSFNGMSAVEGGSSGRGVIQHGVNSSGHNTDPTTAPAAVAASADRDASPSFDDVNAMEGGSSDRGVVQQGVGWSNPAADSRGAPLAAHSASFASEDDDHDAVRNGSANTLSVLGSSGSGFGSVQAGSSGRGLMTGAGLEGTEPFGGLSAPPNRNDFSLSKLAPTKKSVPSTRNTLFLSSSDLVSSESGSVAGGGSGRKIIGRGESNEHEREGEHEDDAPVPTEGREGDTDQMSGAVQRTGGGGGSGIFAFGLLKSRPPVENEVPRRRGIPGLAAAAAAAAAASSSPPLPGDEQLDREGTDESNGGGSSGRNTRGLPRLSRGAEDPADNNSAAGSELPRAGLEERQRHPRHRSEGGQGSGAPFSLLSVGFRKNPTESSLPRRRSVHAPAWGLPVDGSGGSLDTSIRNELEEDAWGPDDSHSGGGMGDALAEEEGDGVGLEVSASGSSGIGGSRGWGLKRRPPVAIDLPRRSSGYSADTSGRSMGGLHTAGCQSLPQQRGNADSGVGYMGSHPEGEVAQSSDEERMARTSSGIGGNSVFAGLVGLNHRPVESGLPRRRRSSEISLPEGQVVLPVEDTSSRADYGASGASAEENEGISGSAVSARRGSSSSSSSMSGRRGWGGGLKRILPVAIDLPRRSSGYSADTSGRSVGGLDMAAGQPLPQQRAHTDDMGADDMTIDAESGIGSSRQDPRGNPSVDAGRQGLFPTLVGHKRAPVESDLPRRRPSEYSTAEGAGTAENGVDNTEAEVVYSDSQNIDSSRSGKGRTRWGLMGRRGPVASDLPRRSSARSSGPSHAATVVACEDALENHDTGLGADLEHSVLTEGVTSVRSGHGLGMSVGSSVGDIGGPSVRSGHGLGMSIGSSIGDIGGPSVRSGHGLGMSVGSSIGDIGGLGTSMGSSAMGESDGYGAIDRGWSGRTRAPPHPPGMDTQAFSIEGGSVAVSLGHGLGLSVGSSIGAGEGGGDGDSLGSSDYEGEAKIPLR